MYISPNNNKPGYEVIDNVEFNDHIRLVLDVDCEKLSLPRSHVSINSKVLIKNFILDFIMWLSNYLCSNKFIIDVNGTVNEIIQFLWDGVVSTMSDNPDKVNTHVIFTNLYTHTDTLKSMNKYFEEYKNTSSSVLAKYIDTQIYKTNTHLRMIYATKCNSVTCILNGCSHNQYVHNPLMLYNRYTKYSDYFYSYIDTSSEPYIHFEISDNV